MAIIKQYTLKYTPLSPVHIGMDETYEPGNYVIDDEADALYSFDTQAAIAALEADDRQQLLAIVNAKPNDEMLSRVQAFFYDHRHKLIGFSNPPIPVAKGVAGIYLKQVGNTVQFYGRHKRIINKLEIERTCYDHSTGRPLFPGSTIKGAIRTALLDKLNAGRKPFANMRNLQLQTQIFRGNLGTDPMRLIRLGDAKWLDSQYLPACGVKFAVNRKRKPVIKDGKLLRSQAEARGLYQLLECVSEQAYQMMEGDLQIMDVSSIRHDDRKLPKQILQWSVKQIAKACNDFYVSLLLKEIAELKSRNYLQPAWADCIEQLINNGLMQILETGEVFLLRLGRHSGAESVTLNGARMIKILQGGKKPVWAKEPKTWWLAADNIETRNEMLPFGWVLVEIADSQVNRSYRQILDNMPTEMQTWFQRQSKKQQGLKKLNEERSSETRSSEFIKQ